MKNALKNLTVSGQPTIIVNGGNLSAKLSAESGYNLPNKLRTVKIGGNVLANTAYNYDSQTGVITISSVTGNVEIIANAVKEASGNKNTSGTEKQEDYWKEVKSKIENADDGDAVKIDANSYDKMPWTVMESLIKNNVTLVIDWNGGKTITIPVGKAQLKENGRVYYPPLPFRINL